MTDPKPSRREFLRRSAGALASISVAPLLPASKAIPAVAGATPFREIVVPGLVVHNVGWTYVSRTLLEDIDGSLESVLADLMARSLR